MLFKQALNEQYMIRWHKNKIVWELPNKNYIYNGTKDEYNLWRQEISDAGYGPKWENERRKVYTRFQKVYKKKKQREDELKDKENYKNRNELIRRKKEIGRYFE